MHLIVYIDYILLWVETKKKACDQASGLGVPAAMSVVYGKHRQICTRTSPVSRDPEVHSQHYDEGAQSSCREIKKIQAESLKLLEAGQMSACTLTRLTGKLDALNQVIPQSPLIYRNF